MALMRAVGASVSIAEKAGAVLRDIMASGKLGIVDKGGINNVQTEADRKAQLLIVSSFTEQCPKATVIGEEDDIDYSTAKEDGLVVTETSAEVAQYACPEQYKNLKEEDLVIWVDPLDGTKEYTEGRKQDVTVLIGIAAHGKAVAGVIYQPFWEVNDVEVGRTLWGVVGLGAFGLEVKKVPEGRKIITTTRSHMQKSVQDAIDSFKPDKVINIGGSGSKCLLVAEGIADCYLFASPGTKKWDTCAGDAIIKALGGKMTDIFGNDIEYHATVGWPNKQGVLATRTVGEFEFYKNKVPADIMQR